MKNSLRMILKKKKKKKHRKDYLTEKNLFLRVLPHRSHSNCFVNIFHVTERK